MTSPSPFREALARWIAIVPVAFLAVVIVGLNVVIDPSAYDVSQLPRLLVLSALLLVLLPLALLVPAVASRLDTSVLREPIVVASAVALLVSTASLAFATNVSAGWTDIFRSLAAVGVLCMACLLLPLDRDWRQRVVQTLVLAAAVAVAIGTSETLTRCGFGLHGRRTMEVVTGRMSNVNLYAGLLALLLPWCLGGTALLAGGWRWLSIATAGSTLALIVMLQSRAAWLAVLVSAAVAGATALACHDRLAVSRNLRRSLAAAFLGGAAAIGGVAALTGSDTPLGRLLQTTIVTRPHQAAGPTDGGRMMIWGVTARMIADHPLTGVGAGNFTIRLHDYYGGDLDFANLSSDNWIQPHNDFLWVAAEKGLPGLVAFAAIFVAALLAVRAVLRSGSPSEARLALVCLMALVAYLVFSCVDFPLDRITHQVHLAILLAVIALGKHAVRPASMRPVPLPGWLVVPPVAAALALGVTYAQAALDQERQVMIARQAGQAGDWKTMRAAARAGATPWKSLDPLATPIAFLEGMAEMRLGRREEATVCLERAFAVNPSRMYITNNLAALYAEAGRFDDAIPLFAAAADRYPDRLEPRHNLAGCLIDAGRFAEAVDVIETVPEEYRTEPLQEMLAFAREQLAAEAGEAPKSDAL
ncbi:MAG: O-antigen ligase family protein [Planctomycetia bacterium]|nr:O-antigen ligase family protein [Planctomycetia bacterium]